MADGDFSMAAEARKLLATNPKLTGRQVEAALRRKFPKQKINTKSCGVAFSMARERLGLRQERMRVGCDDPEVNLLFDAKLFVAKCGGIDQAMAILKQLADLQL